MLLPEHGIINPVPNYRFYQVLGDQREPCSPERRTRDIPGDFGRG